MAIVVSKQSNGDIMNKEMDMSKTEKNLMDAFAGESQANRRYLAYAQRAEDEFLHGIAKLFWAVAAAETIHAHKHLRTAGGVKTTKENLEDALSGETHEFKDMYPKMIAEAKEEGQKSAEIGFNYANEVEKVHAELFKKAMENPDKFPVQDYYICKICGYTVAEQSPDTCPVCGANQKAFFKAMDGPLF
jgi:rubrerythrin